MLTHVPTHMQPEPARSQIHPAYYADDQPDYIRVISECSYYKLRWSRERHPLVKPNTTAGTFPLDPVIIGTAVCLSLPYAGWQRTG